MTVLYPLLRSMGSRRRCRSSRIGAVLLFAFGCSSEGASSTGGAAGRGTGSSIGGAAGVAAGGGNGAGGGSGNGGSSNVGGGNADGGDGGRAGSGGDGGRGGDGSGGSGTGGKSGGRNWVWAKGCDGSWSYGSSVAVLADGSAYVAGGFRGPGVSFG